MKKVLSESLPDWFNIKNYETKSYKDIDWWYQQISKRLWRIDDKNTSPPDLAIKPPLIPNDGQPKLIGNIPLHSLTKLELFSISSKFKDEDMWDHVEKLLNDFATNLIEKYPVTNGKEESPEETKARIKRIMTDHISNPRFFPDSPNWGFFVPADEEYGQGSKCSDSLRIAHLVVNLDATDESLSKSFNHWLKDVREYLKVPAPKAKMFSEVDFSRWYNNKILPYYDLNRWAQLEGVSLSQATIGDAIFPGPNQGNRAERVRKTTKKIAEEILQRPVALALSAQIIEAEKN